MLAGMKPVEIILWSLPFIMFPATGYYTGNHIIVVPEFTVGTWLGAIGIHALLVFFVANIIWNNRKATSKDIFEALTNTREKQDAELMAAAPDLLAERDRLRASEARLVTALREVMCEPDVGQLPPIQVVWEQARAAIAAATQD